MNPGFGGGIVGLPELAFLTIDGTDIDDTPPFALDHAFYNLLGHIEQTVQVGVDHRTPVVLRHFAKQAVPRDSRIVDEDVDWAETLLDIGKSRCSRIPVGHITYRGMKGIA